MNAARSRHPPHRLRSGTAAALLMAWALPFGALAHGALAQSGTDAPSAAETRMPEPSYLEPLNADESAGVLGRKVVGPNGEDFGLITDVIVDRDGRPRAAVIDFGGFLGVGSRKVAVDWNLLQFDPGQRDRKAVLALGRREIQGAPEFRTDAASAEMVGPPSVGPSTGTNGGK
jgi:PRC-barrel domain